MFRSIDLDESEEEVCAGPAQIHWILALNLGAAVRFLKIYDGLAAAVQVGTTVPKLTIPVPSPGATIAGGVQISLPHGLRFNDGITVAATTGIADADTGAPGGNEVVVDIGYVN
jgi:hypothetical protein